MMEGTRESLHRPKRLSQVDADSPEGLAPPSAYDFGTDLDEPQTSDGNPTQYVGATGDRIDPTTGFPFLRHRSSILPTSIISLKNPKVRVGCRVRKISQISELDMSFFCRFTLFLDWHDPHNVGKPPGTYVGTPCVGDGASCSERAAHRRETGDMSFSPLLRFFGATDLIFLTDTPLQPATTDGDGNMKVSSLSLPRYEASPVSTVPNILLLFSQLIISGAGTFDQEYNMQMFPFDVQALRIIVRLQNEEDGVELERIPMSLDG